VGTHYLDLVAEIAGKKVSFKVKVIITLPNSIVKKGEAPSNSPKTESSEEK